MELRANVKYADDKDGSALAHAFMSGVKEYGAFLTGFQTSKDKAEHDKRQDVPLDFNVEEYTEENLGMPTRGQQKGTK